eukprot:4717233-Prymnesium_polylepis.2
MDHHRALEEFALRLAHQRMRRARVVEALAVVTPPIKPACLGQREALRIAHSGRSEEDDSRVDRRRPVSLSRDGLATLR